MNIIEQLGGYEKAKMYYDYLKFTPNNCEEKEGTAVFQITQQNLIALSNALLQYRREHGIYEAGDKIIFPALCNSVVLYAYCLEMFLSQKLFRHATDAEIKANKRLEVGDEN